MVSEDALSSDDYTFLIGTAVDLVETILESDQLHVPYPEHVRLYDDRMALTCADFQGQRLNIGYKDGFVTAVWVG